MAGALGHNRTASGRIPAKAVGSFIPELTKKAFQKYGFSTAALLTDWPTIVGAELARHTRPERLNWPRRAELDDETNSGTRRTGAKVILRVEPARVLDVQYQSQQIKDRINAYFGYAAISDVRFLQAPVEAGRAVREDRPMAPASRSDEPHAEANDLAAALARLEANIAREKSAG
ncbi:MAG: DUF721 domain-containing protein [Hyphomicrobiaceae bacterium]